MHTGFQSNRQSRIGAAAVGLKVLRSISLKYDNVRTSSDFQNHSGNHSGDLIKQEIASKTKSSVMFTDFNSPPSTILHHDKKKESRFIENSNSNNINDDSDNIKNGTLYSDISHLIRNETKSDQFIKIECISDIVPNLVVSSHLSKKDFKHDNSSSLRGTDDWKRDFALENQNSSKINSVKENDIKYELESKNIIYGILPGRRREELKEVEKDKDEIESAEEEYKEEDEEEQEEEEEEEEMSFDDYVPSLKPISSSLSYHQAHRPIISKSITQSSGSQFQKVSSSIFQTKESRSSVLSSQIISPSSVVEKRKLPIEIQRMKGHDFLLTMKNPVRNITDHIVDNRLNRNPDEIDHGRKFNGLSDFPKKKKFDKDFT